MVAKRNTQLTTVPFNGTVRQKDGKMVQRKFQAKVIAVKRQDEDEGEPVKSPAEKTSNVQPNDSEKYLLKDIIPTPYDMTAMVMLEETSNVLRECVDAMVTNIECFGWTYRPRPLKDEDADKYRIEIEIEFLKLQGAFEILCPEVSFMEVRKRLRRDLELTGNAYLEVVRNIDTFELLELNHVPAHRMRLMKLDKVFTPYEVTYIDAEDGYKLKSRTRRKRFRRFVQLDNSGKPIVFFSEYGDQRPRDKKTGQVKPAAEVTVEDRATEIIHFKLYSPRTPYGIPRWVGRWVSVEGSRRAEEINFFTLSNNHVPSMFILVENGELTEASVERLTEVIEGQVAGDPNYSKAVILEAESAEQEVFPGQMKGAKVAVKELGKTQQKESMFQNYDDSNQLKVSRAWRLPPLLIGRADDYTRATAQASIHFADQQVFHPERATFDQDVNRVLRDAGVQWHIYRTRTPNITDNEVLVKAMVAAEKSGGMTPRRADVLMADIFEGSLGPLPRGIDPDVPFTIQFAQAQNAMLPPEGSTTPAEPVERDDGTWVSDYVRTILRGVSD